MGSIQKRRIRRCTKSASKLLAARSLAVKSDDGVQDSAFATLLSECFCSALLRYPRTGQGQQCPARYRMHVVQNLRRPTAVRNSDIRVKRLGKGISGIPPASP